jgi:phosphatidylethanolamine/phosphatidyl-N-methylethanolamine N-methyltransferase
MTPTTSSPRRPKGPRKYLRRHNKTVFRSIDERSGQPRRRKGAAREPGRHRQMREQSTQKIYDIQSKVYDATFGRLVKKRIGKAIAEHVRLREGQSVLDVGIGTGGSLNFYPADRGRIVGIDLSGGMLSKALNKIEETGRANAVLARANALIMPFADDSFDSVFVSHVISVVSDPVRLLDECCRVSRPGSKIVMVNHFQSTNRFVAAVEKLLCPICTKLGWRSDLPLQELVEKSGVTVDYRYKLTTPDLWETVVITNTKPARQAAARV